MNAAAKKNAEIRQIEKLLKQHFPDHPEGYPPTAYRYNSASIRVRIVSEQFEGKNRVERGESVYSLLQKNLPEETWQDITLIILLTPNEVQDSLMNMEFESPTPSRL